MHNNLRQQLYDVLRAASAGGLEVPTSPAREIIPKKPAEDSESNLANRVATLQAHRANVTAAIVELEAAGVKPEHSERNDIRSKALDLLNRERPNWANNEDPGVNAVDQRQPVRAACSHSQPVHSRLLLGHPRADSRLAAYLPMCASRLFR